MTVTAVPIQVSASGANTIVPAVNNAIIKVLAVFLSSNVAANVNFVSHTTTTVNTGIVYLTTNQNHALWDYNPEGWFETVVGEALDINLGGAAAVGGQLLYETELKAYP